MKGIFVLLLLLIFSVSIVEAQTFSEWFQQKKTQKKYLLQQIAALQIYIGYAKKGYDIGKEGLGLIGDIKGGDFSLHKGYFKSLVSVNGDIKNYSAVSATVDLQQNIVAIKNRTVKILHDSKLLTPKEKRYCDLVFERLLDDCANSLDDLIKTSTDGQLGLKDDERLRRIDRIHEDMSDKHLFTVQFSNSAIELVKNRRAGLQETANSLKVHGVK